MIWYKKHLSLNTLFLIYSFLIFSATPLVSYALVGVDWIQTTANAAFPARFGHTAVVFKDKIWVLGGLSTNSLSFYNDIWSSTDGVKWSQEVSNAPWGKRSSHAALVYNDKLWVFGGGGSSGFYSDVWYSNDGVTWTQATSNAPWGRRSYFAATEYNGKMWLLGGIIQGTSPPVRRNDVWSSNDGISWSQITPNANWAPREGHQATVFNNKIWIVGGLNPESPYGHYDSQGEWVDKYFNDSWYSSDGITWNMATANAPWKARHGHALVSFSNRIWVINGFYDFGYEDDVWYSYDGTTWSQATPDAPWAPSYDIPAVVFDQKIWIIGSFSPYQGVWYSEVPYIDIGLRIFDGTSVVKIAAEPLGVLTSPLRIAKNGTIYGIALVAPESLRASKLRVNTNSGVRALRKL